MTAPPTAGPIARDDPHRLQPPRRWDRYALWTILGGLAVFAAGLWVVYGSGLASLGTLTPTLLVLNVLSVALALAGFAWSLARDWRWLAREERDVAFILDEEQQDIGRVLDPRGGAGARRVETLLDDRVSRVLRVERQEAEASTVQEAELRAIAVSRSAWVGSAARYIAGLLLLMTVLGTFIGVKEALPELIDAIRGAGAGDVSAQGLAVALDRVRSAFGANLAALIGSIALGIAGFGLGTARQSLLARLEQASSLYVYSRLHRASAATTLTAALDRLGEASRQLGGVADTLGSFRDAIDDFSRTNRDSLEGTRQMLQTLLGQQQLQMAEQTRETVNTLERQITDTVVAVSQATAHYATLVGVLRDRGDVLGGAVAQMADAVREMQAARQTFDQYASSVVRTVDERLVRLERAARRQATYARRSVDQFERINAGVGAVLEHAAGMAERLGEAEQRRMDAFQQLDRRTAEAVVTLLEPLIDRVSHQGDKVAGAGERVAQSVERVPERVRDGVREALGGERAQSEAALQKSLAQLTAAVRELRADLARPLWRRVVGRRSSDGGE